jgi:hypothetical protein
MAWLKFPSKPWNLWHLHKITICFSYSSISCIALCFCLLNVPAEKYRRPLAWCWLFHVNVRWLWKPNESHGRKTVLPVFIHGYTVWPFLLKSLRAKSTNTCAIFLSLPSIIVCQSIASFHHHLFFKSSAMYTSALRLWWGHKITRDQRSLETFENWNYTWDR